MNSRTLLALAFCAASLAARAHADGAAQAPSKPDAPKAEAPKAQAPKQEYDAIFSDILKSLPQEKRALVDSAHGAKGKAAPPAGPADPEEAKKAAKEKRTKALESLPPEVKSRVDKAILDLDNRRKQKQAELKDLDK